MVNSIIHAHQAKKLVLRKYIVGLMVLCAPSLAASDAPTRLQLEAQVRTTELAFAKTMADRDFKAFASFLATDTIFFNGDTPLRGKDAVLKAWKRYFSGATAPFSWAPEIVVVTGDGTLALSTGPVVSSDGNIRANYSTTWRRSADGTWKVILDKGYPLCPPPLATP